MSKRMQGMLEKLRELCPNELDPYILPIQAIGKSNEHLWAKGTLTLSATEALSGWTAIGLSVARAGFKKIAIVNSHGGNLDLISAAESGGIAPTRAISRGWIAADLNDEGAVGNASLATAIKDNATAAHQVHGFIDLLKEVTESDFQQPVRRSNWQLDTSGSWRKI